MIIKRIVLFFIATSIIFSTGCTVSNKEAVLISEPLNQIDDLFEDNKQAAELSESQIPKTIAILPFQNLTESDGAFEIVRRVIYNHIASKNYHMLHWQAVDDKLALANIDLNRVSQLDPAYLASVLEVDAVVFGDINDFERVFAGIVTQIKVGVELRLFNRNGQLLWQESDSATSRAGGASVTPIGLLLNAALATMHLKEENLLRAADDVGRTLAKLMPEPKRLSTQAGPEIEAVIHNGMNKILKYGDILEVGLKGAPNMRAQANIAGVGSFDLQEVVAGEYIGKIPVTKKANATDAVVEGVLMDNKGNISRWISPFGLLNVDNLAPNPPTEIQVVANDGSLHISWNVAEDSDVSEYKLYFLDTDNKQTVLATSTAGLEATLANLINFNTYQLALAAVDFAGNQGPSKTIVAMPAPDSRFSQLAQLDSNLPSKINQSGILSLANSPYYLKHKTELAETASLLVEPGVQIMVSRNALLTVKGNLLIYGDEKRPVTVTGERLGFRQFLAIDSDQTVELNYLIVDGADVAITIQAGQAQLAYCQLINNKFSALDISGTARPDIHHSIIQGSNTAGVIISGHAQPRFKDNQFVDNQPFHVQSSSIYQLDLSQNQWTPKASQMTILGDIRY